MEASGERNGGICVECLRGVFGTTYPSAESIENTDIHRLVEHRAWS